VRSDQRRGGPVGSAPREVEMAVALASNPARKWLSSDQIGQEDQGVEWRVARAPWKKKGGTGEKGMRGGGGGGARLLLNGMMEEEWERWVWFCVHHAAVGKGRTSRPDQRAAGNGCRRCAVRPDMGYGGLIGGAPATVRGGVGQTRLNRFKIQTDSIYLKTFQTLNDPKRIFQSLKILK
jgi:hypothetical protein